MRWRPAAPSHMRVLTRPCSSTDFDFSHSRVRLRRKSFRSRSEDRRNASWKKRSSLSDGSLDRAKINASSRVFSRSAIFCSWRVFVRRRHTTKEKERNLGDSVSSLDTRTTNLLPVIVVRLHTGNAIGSQCWVSCRLHRENQTEEEIGGSSYVKFEYHCNNRCVKGR